MADDKQTVSVQQAGKFQFLSNKLSSIILARSEGDKQKVELILDEFNYLDYKLSFLKNHDQAVLVINQCCYVVPAEETQLTVKACHLIINLVKFQQINVGGKTLSLAIGWCLECLKHSPYSAKSEILSALQVLLKNNGHRIEDCLSDLIHHEHGALIKLLNLKKDRKSDLENTSLLFIEDIYFNTIKCFEALVFQNTNENKVSNETLEFCFDVFMGQLEGDKYIFQTETLYCKVTMVCIKGLGNIIQGSSDVLHNKISELLGVVKLFMLFGLPGHDGLKLQKLLTSQMCITDGPSLKNYSTNKGIRGKYEKKSKKRNLNTISQLEESEDMNDCNIKSSELEFNVASVSTFCPLWLKTSDSEFSDSESGQTGKLRSNQSKVRQYALTLLGTVIKLAGVKLFMGYLPHFLPDGTQGRTLITSLLKDPSPQSRTELLGILSTILQGGKQYFLQAETSAKLTSYTSFSVTIGNILKELHRCLGLSLISENSVNVIPLVLKCIADLIRCTPYHKLNDGTLTKISKHVKAYLKHKDIEVQCAALSVFGCIISIEKKTDEIHDIIKKPLQPIVSEETELIESNATDNVQVLDAETFEDFEDDDFTECQHKPWILEVCLKNVMEIERKGDMKSCTSNVAVIVESLQVLSSLFRNYFSILINSFIGDITELLEYCSSRNEYPIRLYAGKLMESVFNSIQLSLTNEDEEQRIPLSLVSSFWNSMLKGPLTSLIQNEQPTLRATGCDCLANLGVQVMNTSLPLSQCSLIFDQLTRNKQILCVTLLSGCTRDESPVVKSSAIRGLAIVVLFPSLRDDSLFLFDVIDVVTTSSTDENISVRAQSAWLLGNLSDALCLNQTENIEDNITDDVLLKLLEIGIKLSQDSVKVKPSAVRGVGNILKIMTEGSCKHYKESITRGIDALVKNSLTATFMKARWNSCYAIGNALQNPIIVQNIEYVSKIFNAMINLIQNYKNFKVRISAGFVLSVPSKRENYSDFYILIWAALLNALENTKNVNDLNEYKHRDNLVDQICLTLCHMISLAQAEDVINIQEKSIYHYDNLQHHMSKFHDRIIPEKSEVILRAANNINELTNHGLNSEQRSGVQLLTNIFINSGENL